MKVKRSAQGLILVTIIVLIIIAKYTWSVFTETSNLYYGIAYYQLIYKNNHLLFNKYTNILLPEIGSVILFYLSYLWINFFTIPIFLSAKRKKVFTYLWAALQLFSVGYLLALGINATTYYARPFLFNYGPEFNFVSLFGYNDKPLQHLFFGFDRAIIAVFIYSLCVGVREYISYEIEKSENNPHRILIINQIIACWIIYIDLPLLSLIFALVKLDIYILYFAFVTPAILVYIIQQRTKVVRLRSAEKALTLSKADLQFLRSQINPHFLFNVLNTLYGTALREKAKDTAGGIQKLGDMMRFMLRDNHLDFIPMSSEIAYLNNYISLQKLRIQVAENIAIETNINEDNYGHLIAPMLLIPFVENAFKHGINPLEKSWIKINLSCDKQQIYFEVRNSIFPTTDNDPEEDYSGIGLQNVRERLNLFYKGKHQLNYGVHNEEFVAELIIDTKTNN